MEFETYQPATIVPNKITKPSVFNGMCLVRRYRVTVEEITEDNNVVAKRLIDVYKRRFELGITHSSNMHAMYEEAMRLGVVLSDA